MALLLTACSDGLVYNHSVDVQPDGWAPTDTLFFPIQVDRSANVAMPIERNVPYCLGLSVRYERYYPAGTIQVHARLDDGDVHTVNLPLGDVHDMPEGDRWGSLCIKEFNDIDPWFAFADSGSYFLKIWPDTLTEHIVSITATLE